MQREKEFNYAGLTLSDVVSHIAEFAADLWHF